MEFKPQYYNWHYNAYHLWFKSQLIANPGLKVNQSVYFSCIQMFSTSSVLCEIIQTQTEGEEI